MDYIGELRRAAREAEWGEWRRQGRVAALLEQLAARFGKLPGAVKKRVKGASEETLLRWALRVLTAGTLAEVFEGGEGVSEDKAKGSVRKAQKRG